MWRTHTHSRGVGGWDLNTLKANHNFLPSTGHTSSSLTLTLCHPLTVKKAITLSSTREMSNRTSERNRRRKKIARRKERQTTTKSKNWSTISPGTMEITQPNHRVTYACTNRFPLALALLAIFVVVFLLFRRRFCAMQRPKARKAAFFCLFDHNHFHNLASGMTSSFRCWELCVRVSERVREGVWARRDMDYETRGTLTYWRECERNERTIGWASGTDHACNKSARVRMIFD